MLVKLTCRVREYAMGLGGGVIAVGHFLPVLYVVAALAGECFNIFAVVRSKWCYNT